MGPDSGRSGLGSSYSTSKPGRRSSGGGGWRSEVSSSGPVRGGGTGERPRDRPPLLPLRPPDGSFSRSGVLGLGQPISSEGSVSGVSGWKRFQSDPGASAGREERGLRWVRLGGRSGSYGSSSSRAVKSASESSWNGGSGSAGRSGGQTAEGSRTGCSIEGSAVHSLGSGQEASSGSRASAGGRGICGSNGGSSWIESGSMGSSGSGQGSGCETKPSPKRRGRGSERSRRPLIDWSGRSRSRGRSRFRSRSRSCGTSRGRSG